MAEIALATPDFDRILRDTGVANADAIRVIWLLLQDEINRRERLSQTVGGTSGHNLLSTTHPDTIPADPQTGDIIVALGSTPVDSGGYWIDGSQEIFIELNSVTGTVQYWLDGSAFLQTGFSSSSGSGTKWQRMGVENEGDVLTIVGGVPAWAVGGRDCASIYGATNQAITSSNATLVIFSTAEFDTAAFFNVATPTKLIVPAGKGGKYLVIGQLAWSLANNGPQRASILVNGTAVAVDEGGNLNGNAIIRQGVVRLCNLNVGDYVELEAFQSSGGAETVTAGIASTFLQLVRVG